MQAGLPRSVLDCQALSIHLPPPSCRYQDAGLESPYLSPPMSASSASLNDPSYYYKQGHRQQSISPTAVHSSSKSSISDSRKRSLTLPGSNGSYVVTNGADNHLRTSRDSVSGESSWFSSGGTLQEEESTDENSPNGQESPNTNYALVGSPGTARRAKAHVPSACVNCKKKHLACETRRPCNRCVQAGKQVGFCKNAWIILCSC